MAIILFSIKFKSECLLCYCLHHRRNSSGMLFLMIPNDQAPIQSCRSLQARTDNSVWEIDLTIWALQWPDKLPLRIIVLNNYHVINFLQWINHGWLYGWIEGQWEINCKCWPDPTYSGLLPLLMSIIKLCDKICTAIYLLVIYGNHAKDIVSLYKY